MLNRRAGSSVVSSEQAGGYVPDNTLEPVPPHVVIRAWEAERARLARELHDGPVQSVANAIFALQYGESLLERDPAALREVLGRVQQDLKVSLRDLRRGIADLRPPALTELGLWPALRHYCAELERHFRIAIRVDVPAAEVRLGQDVEVAIFRVAQEALLNAVRHSRGARINLCARRRARDLVLRVDDNGAGIQPSDSELGQRFGIRGM